MNDTAKLFWEIRDKIVLSEMRELPSDLPERAKDDKVKSLFASLAPRNTGFLPPLCAIEKDTSLKLNFEAIFMQADILEQSQCLDALFLNESLLEQRDHPRHYEAVHQKARILKAAGHLEKAKEQYLSASMCMPDEWKNAIHLGLAKVERALLEKTKPGPEELEEEYRRILERLEEASLNQKAHMRGKVLYEMGDILYGRNCCKEAIERLEEAIKQKGYIQKWRAHNLAANCYTKLLDPFADAQTGPENVSDEALLGYNMHQLTAFVEAKKHYIKADRLLEKNNLAEKTYGNKARVINNLACLYLLSPGTRSKVQGCLNKAKDCGNKEEAMRAECIRYLILKADELKSELEKAEPDNNETKNKLNNLKKTFGDVWRLLRGGHRNAWDYSNPETRIRHKLITIVTSKQKYKVDCKKANDANSCQLTILRNCSSSEPLLKLHSGNDIRGGGYFLQWEGKGVVIDPGHDFLTNFHEEGFLASAIDSIFVSHDHADHNNDLVALESLLYEVEQPYGVFCDLLTYAKVSRLKGNLDLRADAGVSCFGEAGARSRWSAKMHSGQLRVKTHAVYHRPLVENTAVASCFEMGEIRLGYTGDMRYHPAKDFELVRFFGKCDILIAHLSQPAFEEYDNERAFQEGHLGLNGLVALVNAVKPRLVLVGEFKATHEDLRLDLIIAIQKRLDYSAVVLPTSKGMRIRLPDFSIKCLSCDQWSDFKKTIVRSSSQTLGDLPYICTSCA